MVEANCCAIKTQKVSKTNDKESFPDKFSVPLPHFTQRFRWDCGVTCVLMVVKPKFQQQLFENFEEICRKEGFRKSTWSIDLCFLLRKFQVRHVLYTKTIGVHPNHIKASFYKQTTAEDEARVNRRFGEAAERGVIIRKVAAGLSVRTLLKHLQKGPIIVLVNAKLLTCDLCRFNKASYEIRKCLPWQTKYQGHYIVLAGYNRKIAKIFYHNPTLKEQICAMSIENFEEARKDYGTDQDTILIFQ